MMGGVTHSACSTAFLRVLHVMCNLEASRVCVCMHSLSIQDAALALAKLFKFHLARQQKPVCYRLEQHVAC